MLLFFMGVVHFPTRSQVMQHLLSAIDNGMAFFVRPCAATACLVFDCLHDHFSSPSPVHRGECRSAVGCACFPDMQQPLLRAGAGCDGAPGLCLCTGLCRCRLACAGPCACRQPAGAAPGRCPPARGPGALGGCSVAGLRCVGGAAADIRQGGCGGACHGHGLCGKKFKKCCGA